MGGFECRRGVEECGKVREFGVVCFCYREEADLALVPRVVGGAEDLFYVAVLDVSADIMAHF